jgi:hypothetical protein
MGDTILMRIMVMLFLMSLAVSAQESEEAPVTPKGGDIYLRVANLLPLSMERVTILADGKAWLRGLKPGFFSGYQPLDKSGPDEFQVQLGSRRVGTAKLRQADDASYYTLVIIGSNSQPELVLRADNPLIEEKEPEEGKTTGTAHPRPSAEIAEMLLRRLRISLSGRSAGHEDVDRGRGARRRRGSPGCKCSREHSSHLHQSV